MATAAGTDRGAAARETFGAGGVQFHPESMS